MNLSGGHSVMTKTLRYDRIGIIEEFDGSYHTSEEP